MIYSVIIPVYRNEESIPDLLAVLGEVRTAVAERFGMSLEVVFVVDGSPDRSFAVLEERLPAQPFRSQLLLHARNFGAFPAMRTGLRAASGDYCGIIAADLQEPPTLLVDFLGKLASGEADIVIGVREGRADPAFSRMSANLFWRLYRHLVNPEIPPGGVDMFGCTRQVRDELVRLPEVHTSLVGLVYWLGFRRTEVGYRRRPRQHGRSAWTFRKKVTYLLDSIFAFTDLPVRLLTLFGFLGAAVTLVFGVVVLVARLLGWIDVSGYATTTLLIMFFGALNTFGIGLIGHYSWRTYENTKQRPVAVVQSARSFGPASGVETDHG